MQWQTPSSKWWKRLASITMMALPTIFEMNFVDVWQSLQIRRFFLIQRGVPGGVLMSPNAIASFSLWWHKGNTFSSSTSSRTISAVLHGFQLSEGGLDHLLQAYGPHYSLQSMCHWAISSHLFPFSAIQHPHRDICSQQQCICLTAVHKQQHFQAPIQ